MMDITAIMFINLRISMEKIPPLFELKILWGEDENLPPASFN